MNNYKIELFTKIVQEVAIGVRQHKVHRQDLMEHAIGILHYVLSNKLCNQVNPGPQRVLTMYHIH